MTKTLFKFNFNTYKMKNSGALQFTANVTKSCQSILGLHLTFGLNLIYHARKKVFCFKFTYYNFKRRNFAIDQLLYPMLVLYFFGIL